MARLVPPLLLLSACSARGDSLTDAPDRIKRHVPGMGTRSKAGRAVPGLAGGLE